MTILRDILAHLLGRECSHARKRRRELLSLSEEVTQTERLCEALLERLIRAEERPAVLQ